MFNWLHQHIHTIKWMGKIPPPSCQHNALLYWDTQIPIVRWWFKTSMGTCFNSSGESTISKDGIVKMVHTSVCCCCCCCCRCSHCISVVGSKCMQVAQLAQATLDVCHVDLNIILETTKKYRKDNNIRKVQDFGVHWIMINSHTDFDCCV